MNGNKTSNDYFLGETFSSICLFPPIPDEDDASVDGGVALDEHFKGDIIIVNPSAFGSSQFPNAKMALDVARTVAEVVSCTFPIE